MRDASHDWRSCRRSPASQLGLFTRVDATRRRRQRTISSGDSVAERGHRARDARGVSLRGHEPVVAPRRAGRVPRRRTRVRRVAPHGGGAPRLRRLPPGRRRGARADARPSSAQERDRAPHASCCRRAIERGSDAIPVTSRARTLIDLGAVAPADRVEEAFDGAERDGSVRRRHVERRYRALRAPGSQRHRRDDADPRRAGSPSSAIPRSVLERRMRRLLDERRLAAAGRSYRVRLPDGTRVRDRLRVRRPAARDRGRRTRQPRDAAVSARPTTSARTRSADVGWTLRRFTYEQVMHDPAPSRRRCASALEAPRRPLLMTETRRRRDPFATLMTNCGVGRRAPGAAGGRQSMAMVASSARCSLTVAERDATARAGACSTGGCRAPT